MIKTIYWDRDTVVMIDQRALPHEERYITCRKYEDVIVAINNMTIRGAPAIGIAAAMGIALGILNSPKEQMTGDFYKICNEFSQTRPTAVNLFGAINRMKSLFEKQIANTPDIKADAVRTALIKEARRIHDEDIRANRQMGIHGRHLINDGDTILTHCNAGALATGGYGTALGVMRAAHEEGKKIHVLVDETRPLLQGARLTAWEMKKEGIPATLITDNMAGSFMKRGLVNLVIVGADRIAANGDVANKIGTYSLAVLAQANRVPFYAAAPISTIDCHTKTGTEITIEERSEDEVLKFHGTNIAPEGFNAHNPAFDVTPNRYITAIITEKGVVTAPFLKGFRKSRIQGFE
ncbi:MAG: S-methyl-5-thioribose-1-phosphate isomerase [Thermodesulfobacteriota bacterium]|nr:S-methyl-5-thioribose-1-phosphate isomerase [Thermodesulfobacteriota bacterium]